MGESRVGHVESFLRLVAESAEGQKTKQREEGYFNHSDYG